MEKHERDKSGIVTALHPIGTAAVVRLFMFADGDGQRNHLSLPRLSNRGGISAVNQSDRKMPAQVDNIRPRQPLHQLGYTRPNTRQIGNRGE